LLATGGAGHVFRETTNPPIATGDGIALAFHAGVRVADLEFVQFHPTVLSCSAGPRFLVSEAVRGEGARLVNEDGDAFMARYHPDADLAPRDVVARSIVREVQRTGGPVFLTLAHLDSSYVRHRFPTITAICRRIGLDLAHDRIPVGPAAHYIMGGIDTDAWGRTSAPGLFAAGEVACTGVHGANRLASNSLLEGLVFGARAARAMQAPLEAAARKPDRVAAATASWARPLEAEGIDRRTPSDSRPQVPDGVRDVMWRAVGLFRTGRELREAVALFDADYEARCGHMSDLGVRDNDAWRHFNLLTVARLIARAALRREESRGGHFRTDFPQRDDRRWKIHLTD
jgi:L-aspartate oxidase